MWKKEHIPWNKGLTGEKNHAFGKKFPSASEKLKGHIAWNKGLTKNDHPGIARQSQKMMGKTPPNKGRHLVEKNIEYNYQIIETRKLLLVCWCGCGSIINLTSYHLCPGVKIPRYIHNHYSKVSWENCTDTERIARSQPRIISSAVARRGIKQSEESNKKRSLALFGIERSDDFRRNVSDGGKKVWEDYSEEEKSERIKACLAGTRKNPNKEEFMLFGTICNLSSDYQLNTRGEVIIIGGKIPDIVNINGKKKLIELFGDFWHGEKRTGRTKEEEENRRINYFKQFGWDTLVVWGHELKDTESLRIKLRNFL